MASQRRKAAIKVTDLMIHFMFTLGPLKIAFDPKEPIDRIEQKCSNWRTCCCLPHLCIYSYSRFERSVFSNVCAKLNCLRDFTSITFCSENRSETRHLNPLYLGLRDYGLDRGYIQLCLRGLVFKATLNGRADEVSFHCGTDWRVPFPICREQCSCCPII